MLHLEHSPFDAELAASPRWVLGLMLVSALLLGLLAGLRADPPPWLIGTVMLLVLTAALGWNLHTTQPRAAAWLTVTGLAAIILLAGSQPGVGALLALLGVTTILAVTLIGLPAGLLLSAGETVGLLGGVILIPAISPVSVLIATTSIWTAFAAMVAAYRPIHHVAAWSWQYYRDAQAWLEQAQADRAEMEHMLADLVHAHRQLSLAHEREAALRQAAEDARQDKARFAARVSHEFRTPLNVIIGMVSLMVERPQQYEAAIPVRLMEHLQAVNRNCRHLASMVDDVLDLSQADAGRVKLRKESVSLPDLLASAINVIRPLAEKKGLSLNLEAPSQLPTLTCDRVRIRQVLLNLLGNAVRFTDQGGITLRAMTENDQVLLEVRDTGTGMTAEDAARVFEPFVQGGNDPAGAQGGSGLGLAISKQFVELHDGRIWLESAPGQGTTFFVILPLHDAPPPLAGPGRWNKEEWQWMEGRGRAALSAQHYRPRLLLWDTIEGLTDAARTVGNAEIVTVRDATMFADQMRETVHATIVNAYPPAALESLMDAACHALPDAPVLGCSFLPRAAYAEQADVLAYVTKPLSLTALADAVGKLPAVPRRGLVVDDDPDARELMQLALAALYPQMAVETAPNGATALQQLKTAPADLLLLDVIMPGLSGWEVLAAKQAEDTLRHIPTIIVSAQDVIEGPVMSERLLLTTEGGFTGQQVVDCALALGRVVLGGS